ncbi:MAG TPA: hypothetical protein VJ032_03225 [Thermoanaerobaculia bacterium]|nr:hypothetical protein [Thermoanaerobaculia bacterium]
MTDTQNFDSIRSNALAQMERTQRYFHLALFGAVFFESVCGLAFLLTANLHDPLHRLLLFAVGVIYMPIVLGLLALGAFVNRCTLRVLARLDDLER